MSQSYKETAVQRQWMRLSDAAHVLGISYQEAWKLALLGHLIARRAPNGVHWLVARQSVVELRRARRAKAA